MTIQSMDHVGIVVDDLDAALGTVASPWRGARWRGGALRRHLSALLRPRPGGDHRRAGGADRLRCSCARPAADLPVRALASPEPPPRAARPAARARTRGRRRRTATRPA